MISVVETIGHDAEVFLVDQTGKYISAEGLIGGTKDHPLMLDHRNGALQEDNVMMELNIRPARTPDEFVDFTQQTLRSAYREFIEPNGLNIRFDASGDFDDDQLGTAQSTASGCASDFRLGSYDANERIDLSNTNTRYCGGHLHFGLTLPKVYRREVLARAADIFNGIIDMYDTDEVRKRVYGAIATRHRPKPYGVEYRTMSNWWMKSPTLARFVATIGFAIGNDLVLHHTRRAGTEVFLARYGITAPDINKLEEWNL